MPVYRVGSASFATHLIHPGSRSGFTSAAPDTSGYASGIQAARIAQPKSDQRASRPRWASAMLLGGTIDTAYWSEAVALNVNTGADLPAELLPEDLDTLVVPSFTRLLTVSAKLDHVVTPTADPTLRLHAQVDTDPAFGSPSEAYSARVAGGQRAEVSIGDMVPGTIYLRIRGVADYGDASAWLSYEGTLTLFAPFIENPQWQQQVGTRPNRVFVRIAGGTTVRSAELDGLSADDYVDYWTEVPAGTTTGEADSTATAILNALQARAILVSGPVPLTVGLNFGKLFIAEWWDRDGDSSILREEHSLILAKKEHDVDAGTTTLSLGDYAPPPEETIARLLAKLSRP